MYVYIEGASDTKRGKVYLVGFYLPTKGNFYVESTYSDAQYGKAKASAAERVHYLNGGN